eukprot:m.108479 g.108479  ORF g.108479 m.108479 type:complete len:498 (-) comp13967_c0_seq2:79-1572(-)
MGQDFFNDGVNVFGRLSSLITCVVITFYVTAFFIPHWGESEEDANALTQKVGLGEHFGQQAKSAQFGLDSFCIEIVIENWDHSAHSACFNYDDDFTTCADSDNCITSTGCDRFDNICKTRDIVKVSLAIAILALVAGATFSEKTKYLGYSQIIGALGGLVAMASWMYWLDNEGTVITGDDNMDLGTGGILITTGWVLALFGAILTWMDHCCTDADNRKPLAEDGVSVCGRFGSLFTVFVWIMILLAATSPNWTTVSSLGAAGDFCAPDEVTSFINTTSAADLCRTRAASFGLWMYCVEESIEYFGQGNTLVCLEWRTKVKVTGGLNSSALASDEFVLLLGNDANVTEGFGPSFNISNATNLTEALESIPTLDGKERFSFADAQGLREFTIFACLAAFGAAILADVFSEKAWIGWFFMFATAIGCLAGLSAWVDFQSKLKKGRGVAGVEYHNGFFIILGALLTSMAACTFYCYNISALRRAHKQPSGSTKPTNNKNIV